MWGLTMSTSSHQPPSAKRSTISCYTTALGFLNRPKILRDMLCNCRLHTQASLHGWANNLYSSKGSSLHTGNHSWTQITHKVQISNPTTSTDERIMNSLIKLQRWQMLSTQCAPADMGKQMQIRRGHYVLLFGCNYPYGFKRHEAIDNHASHNMKQILKNTGDTATTSKAFQLTCVNRH